jgi:hypothetical protein
MMTASYQQHLLSKQQQQQQPPSRSQSRPRSKPEPRSRSRSNPRPSQSERANSTVTSLTNSQVGYMSYESSALGGAGGGIGDGGGGALDVSIDEVVESYLGPSPLHSLNTIDSDHSRRFFLANVNAAEYEASELIRPSSHSAMKKERVPRYLVPTLASHKKTSSRRVDYPPAATRPTSRSGSRERKTRMPPPYQPQQEEGFYLPTTPHIPVEYMSFASSSYAPSMRAPSSAPASNSRPRSSSQPRPPAPPSSSTTASSSNKKMTKAQYALIYGSLAPQEDSKSWRYSLRN